MIRKFVLLSLPALLRLLAPDLGIESAVGMLMMLLSGMGYSSMNPFRNQRDQMLMLPTQIVQAIADCRVMVVMLCPYLFYFS